jgi:hypothetical protein
VFYALSSGALALELRACYFGAGDSSFGAAIGSRFRQEYFSLQGRKLAKLQRHFAQRYGVAPSRSRMTIHRCG